MSGLTEAGLEIETFESLVTGVKAEYQSELGASLDLSDETPDGVMINIVCDRLADLYELTEAVHNVGDPDAATGAAQDSVCALTGTLREGAAPSTVSLLLIGDVATNVTAGSRASDPVTDSVWTTDETVALIACTVWAISTAYTVGQVRSNADRIYRCITAGTSAGAGGPTTTAADITDGSVHWKYLGEGLGVISVPATCTMDGPTVAGAYAINTIDTPVSGWENVVNLLDADLGSNEETHEELRVRRELELGEQGVSIPDAIRAEMIGDDGPDDVTSCTVFFNNTDATDGDSIPPHSVEVMVRGGEDQAIWDQLFQSVAGGIRTHGDEVGSAVDSQGTSHVMKFTRPEELLVYIIITVEVDELSYPADVADQVKAAIVAYGDELGIGRDIRARPLGAACMAISGVLDATEVLIGVAPAPATEATVTVTNRQLALYDTSRITVVVSEVTA